MYCGVRKSTSYFLFKGSACDSFLKNEVKFYEHDETKYSTFSHNWRVFTGLFGSTGLGRRLPKMFDKKPFP
jgi:hypothetical protein